MPTPRSIEPANPTRLRRTGAGILAVLNSAEFIDSTPMEVFATLLDRGVYLCSISTMYRILRDNAQVKERRRQARHPARAIPELVATGPGQVYTWDITKLPGPCRGVYYDAYVMIDIYSRYIVGAHVHARESGPLAEEMMREVFGIHGIPAVVHADRGTSMTSKVRGQAAGRPGSDQVALATEGLQRQSLLRSVVQDVEIRPWSSPSGSGPG